MDEPGSWRRDLRNGTPRPGLITNGLGFATGVGVLFLLPSLPPFLPSVLLSLLATLLGWRLPPLRPLAFGALGFLWAQIQVCQILCEPFPEPLVGEDIELTGRIADLPGAVVDGVRFLFRVERARAGRQEMPA
jgi:competence protein ComEC